MQFSSIPTLIDAYFYHELNQKPLKGASIFVVVSSKNPLILEDHTRSRLTAPDDDFQAYFTSYDKINVGTTICLENVEIKAECTKTFDIESIQIISKSVTIEVHTSKEAKLKNFELKVSLQKLNGEFLLVPSTRRYLRRLQKQQLVKKNYKPAKIDILSFISASKKKNKKGIQSPQFEILDSQSVSILNYLLDFVDKEELFKTLLRKTFKDNKSKKLVRLAVVPTDVDDEEQTMQIKKKKYSRNTIQELRAEYEAREGRIKQE